MSSFSQPYKQIFSVRNDDFPFHWFKLNCKLTSPACRHLVSANVFLILLVDAMFHYRFITFKSYFPLVKEDLVYSVCVRASMGMSLYAVFQRYYLSAKMPMAYHVCSGTNPLPIGSHLPQGSLCWHTAALPQFYHGSWGLSFYVVHQGWH